MDYLHKARIIKLNKCLPHSSFIPFYRGYELGKRITPRNWGTASDLMTATIAQTVAGIVFCPIDIVKQRVQTASVMGVVNNGGATATAAAVDAAALRITPAQAAREVWTHQGIKGFFRGYWTMNALWMPWNLIYLSTYEAAKRRVYRWQLAKLRAERGSNGGYHNNNNNNGYNSNVSVVGDLPMSQVLPVWAFPVCSSSCAALAAVATHPLDVVKTRLQVLTAAEKGQKRRSAWQVAGELWHTEGLKGFTRGAGARIATLSVGSSTSWFCYEMVKRQLEMNFPWREEDL
jgi:solute carrier family 25 (mitochondrial citrate transporter), member 1